MRVFRSFLEIFLTESIYVISYRYLPLLCFDLMHTPGFSPCLTAAAWQMCWIPCPNYVLGSSADKVATPRQKKPRSKITHHVFPQQFLLFSTNACAPYNGHSQYSRHSDSTASFTKPRVEFSDCETKDVQNRMNDLRSTMTAIYNES